MILSFCVPFSLSFSLSLSLSLSLYFFLSPTFSHKQTKPSWYSSNQCALPIPHHRADSIPAASYNRRITDAYSKLPQIVLDALSWRKILPAAVSPPIRLRFAVTTKPACENKRSEAAGEAWVARYLRASSRPCECTECRVSLLRHHTRGPPMPSTTSGSISSA